ncbi:hypothetical protein CEXT_331911 [Caerostris extrusa]|uniref:Uncharacterized protein n=1 Tax=Caerostris extrusa TaxID=172846 RepID=A0AAV4VR65_CAEEX|nr:hypothetical protein CEXT_331911 [Caerostris extrusa]
MGKICLDAIRRSGSNSNITSHFEDRVSRLWHTVRISLFELSGRDEILFCSVLHLQKRFLPSLCRVGELQWLNGGNLHPVMWSSFPKVLHFPMSIPFEVTRNGRTWIETHPASSGKHFLREIAKVRPENLSCFSEEAKAPLMRSREEEMHLVGMNCN